MFSDIEHTAMSIGQALVALPTAARVVSDLENGRDPSACDLKMNDHSFDLQY